LDVVSRAWRGRVRQCGPAALSRARLVMHVCSNIENRA
jgi:hypothetical protein